jgi:CspA family cold shock protein
MKKGTVKEYDRGKGFGFVTTDDGEGYFVHVSGLRVDIQTRGLRAGQRVMFDIQFDVKGNRAVNVRLSK